MLFEPGLSTDNLGDQIIVDGVKAAFKQIKKNRRPDKGNIWYG